MAIKYLVGIDFGHGETTVSYIDLTKIDKYMNIAEISEKIDHLRIVDKVGIDACVIDSVIYRKPNENGSYVYRLQGGEGYDICTSFKSKISLLNRPNKKEEKEAFRNFIQLVYKNILENNKSILDQDGKNFLLYIASPTLWSVQDKEEYKRFVEDAIGRKVEWVINESDAAYYQKRQSSGLILVVDFGSSTIDFTLVYNNKKIDIDNLSNIHLGAQNVELQMFSSYTTGIDTRNQYLERKAISESLLRKENMTYINLNSMLLYALRRRKEEAYSDGYGKRDEDGNKAMYGFDWRYSFARERMVLKCKPYECFFEDENSLLGSYIEDVKSLFQEVKEVIDQKCAPADIQQLQLIVSGGASRMPWVREKLSEVFEIPLETIELKRDDRPEFIVSDGIVKYAYALYQVRKEIAQIVNELKNWLPDLEDSIRKIIAHTCQEMCISMLDANEGMIYYKSKLFKDEKLPDEQNEANIYGKFFLSSIEGFAIKTLDPINKIIYEHRDFINEEIFRQIDQLLHAKLDPLLKASISKLFGVQVNRFSLLKANQPILPQIANDFTVGSNRLKEIVSCSLKEFSKAILFGMFGWLFENTGYGTKDEPGTINKKRGPNDRNRIVKAYYKFIRKTEFAPYSLETINENIYNYVLDNIVTMVEKKHLTFDPCGYDLKAEIQSELERLERLRTFTAKLALCKGNCVTLQELEGIPQKDDKVEIVLDGLGVLGGLDGLDTLKPLTAKIKEVTSADNQIALILDIAVPVSYTGATIRHKSE